MATAAPIPMPIDRDVLTLSQWLSPAYPVGAFAYSHGLEAAVDRGWVKHAADLEEWLLEVLGFGAGQADVRFLAAAYHASSDDELSEIDSAARAFAASRERLLEADQMGTAFGRTTTAIWPDGRADLCYPVALGHAASAAGIALDLTGKLFLQAFVSNLIAAAQRLLPLGQTDAQAMLHRLSAHCIAVAETAQDGDLTALSGTAFLGDIAAMHHETQYSRIFRT
jgi:urease accessory protein